MASIYRKDRSPYWYIRYRDIRTGGIVDTSTKLRRDNREQTRQARKLCAERTAEEFEAPANRGNENWQWVAGWISVRHTNSDLTRIRYEAAWFALSAFFEQRRIACPRQLQREHLFDYIVWRQSSDSVGPLGLRPAAHNTALLEIKMLSGVMREAVIRRLAPANPCMQLGIGRKKGRQKPEITPREEVIIADALNKLGDDAMSIAWKIAMLQGRRLKETCVALDDVDTKAGTITFRNKGGDMRTKLLHPELFPLFTRLKKQRKRFAYDMPPNFSKKWKYFFRRLGLPHLSFHCTRVTVVNRLRDAGVDRRDAMDFVDHSDYLVNRSYEREKPVRQSAAVAALSLVSAAEPPLPRARGRKRSS